ncbi:MAG: hypothetical protein JO150_13855 [Acidobacteriaceae bacterium]|nr:hypothetical protein [Acidobacteriaceae bacterium]
MSEAAMMLNNELFGRVPHVLGTSVGLNTKTCEEQLWVHVDAHQALQSPAIPATYQDFKVGKVLWQLTPP